MEISDSEINIPFPSIAPTICPYEKNRTRKIEIIIPTFLTFLNINPNTSNESNVRHNEYDNAATVSEKTTSCIFWEKRAKIGKTAKKRGWTTGGFNQDSRKFLRLKRLFLFLRTKTADGSSEPSIDVAEEIVIFSWQLPHL